VNTAFSTLSAVILKFNLQVKVPCILLLCYSRSWWASCCIFSTMSGRFKTRMLHTGLILPFVWLPPLFREPLKGNSSKQDAVAVWFSQDPE